MRQQIARLLALAFFGGVLTLVALVTAASGSSGAVPAAEDDLDTLRIRHFLRFDADLLFQWDQLTVEQYMNTIGETLRFNNHLLKHYYDEAKVEEKEECGGAVSLAGKDLRPVACGGEGSGHDDDTTKEGQAGSDPPSRFTVYVPSHAKGDGKPARVAVKASFGNVPSPTILKIRRHGFYVKKTQQQQQHTSPNSNPHTHQNQNYVFLYNYKEEGYVILLSFVVAYGFVIAGRYL
ncbi:hypothetical protein STCU_10864 [Strigomonas culicis]|uniref:Uncharacterized protein n=1 Tax=Strigomonas culicis TaxID=28005 RepID=S9TG20_9TRYP|nr:hypothetical protein STCU_10864 [Strigomonas culicis]|eukprot:EPY17007.1 hypothetical protein STCU_10864 [Strigomonas culicis]